MAQLVLGEAKAVGANDCAVFEGDVVAEDAALADDRVGVGKEVAAGLHAGVEHYVGQKRGVGPSFTPGPMTT